MNLKLERSGKVLTIFLVIIAVLLITMTAASIFFFQKEIEKRKLAENSLQKASMAEQNIQSELKKLQSELEEVRKQNFLLQEKNKEADDQINSFLDELELEKGLREEMKIESAQMKKTIDGFEKEKAAIKSDLTKKIQEYEQKIVELEAQLKVETNKRKSLEAEMKNGVDLQSSIKNSGAELNNIIEEIDQTVSEPSADDQQAKKEEPEMVDVQLDQIVVTPTKSADDLFMDELLALDEDASGEESMSGDSGAVDGRILSVDEETDFVIINLGQKSGVDIDSFMSVYRGQEYLGDIKITRVQSDMSAADIIPPLSSKMIRKNDQVVFK